MRWLGGVAEGSVGDTIDAFETGLASAWEDEGGEASAMDRRRVNASCVGVAGGSVDEGLMAKNHVTEPAIVSFSPEWIAWLFAPI